ncbi:hypothetical protein HDU96_005937 [Phlyctochytrium bullatum]|nr:hypothetical protein HDU96_005937 [Phlyctochytrium bullatum]
MLFTTFGALTLALSVVAVPQAPPQLQSNWINVAGNTANVQVVNAAITGNKGATQNNNIGLTGNVGGTQQFNGMIGSNMGLQQTNVISGSGNVGGGQMFSGQVIANKGGTQQNLVDFQGNMGINQQFGGSIAGNLGVNQQSHVQFVGNQAAQSQEANGAIGFNTASGSQTNVVNQVGNAAQVQNGNFFVTGNAAGSGQQNGINAVGNAGGSQTINAGIDANNGGNGAPSKDAEIFKFMATIPELPKALADVVAVGNQVHAFTILAAGTQNYNCNATATNTFAWALKEPEAALYVYLPMKDGTFRLREVGTHGFTSPFFVNPYWTIKDEDCVATIDFLPAARADSPQDPKTNIPWLATKRATTTAKIATKPEGCSTLTTKLYLGSTLMLRLNTVGGVAPPAGECKADTVNKVVKVPYHTAYWAYVDPKESGKLLVDVIDESIQG